MGYLWNSNRFGIIYKVRFDKVSSNAESYQTADGTKYIRTSKEQELKGLETTYWWLNIKIYKNSTKLKNLQINCFARFCLLCSSCAFLVLYNKGVIFRPFNSSSVDMLPDNLQSAVWQLAAFKDTLAEQ